MRKNGVNRTLTPIDGGVCAPSGFRAGGIYANIERKQENVSRETNIIPRADLGLLLADRRYPTACVFADGRCGVPSKVTKKHIQSGYSRAMLVNSGIANAFGESIEKAEKTTRRICQKVAKVAKIIEEDVAIASTGKLGLPFDETPVLENIDMLVQSVTATSEGSLALATAMMTTDYKPKQLAFSFYVGDVPCKIGVVCKGSARVCPNMATTLCFITTDVCISPKMLDKALRSAVSETLNNLVGDGISSPNDCAYIIASGKAGNYIIENSDSEYRKFLYALKETLFFVCKALVLDEPNKKLLVCKMQGVKSSRLAKFLAKEVIKVSGVRTKIAQNAFDVEDVLHILSTVDENIPLERTEISIATNAGVRVLYEDGKTLNGADKPFIDENNIEYVEIRVQLNDGNYQATAIGNDG